MFVDADREEPLTRRGFVRSGTPRVRVGFSFWGFLADGVLDTPDGGRSYRRAVIDAIDKSRYEVVLLQANRDLSEAGTDLSVEYRFDAGLPPLDAIIYEWRWPLPGRNTTPCGTPGHTCDLHRQQQLLDHYTHLLGLPTIIWDQDRRLRVDDPLRSQCNVRVAEYALLATPGAVTVTCPVPDELLDTADPQRLARELRDLHLVYVGNQYDRDDAFGRYFAPAAVQVPHRVAGKWIDVGAWPHVRFTGRCRFEEVAGIHRRALATVLLLPQRYRTVGHQTSRLFESVVNGCLPLTPADTACAEAFTPTSLHVADAGEVIDRVRWITSIAGSEEHAALIGDCLKLLDPCRASRQVATLISTLHGLAGFGRPIPARSS